MKALYALALVSTLAFGQSGVPLTTPAAANAAQQAKIAELKRQTPEAVSMTPVSINPNALASNVISMEIEGKVYRFVGKLSPPAEPSMQNGVLTPDDIEMWVGTSDRGTATFTRQRQSVSGYVVIDMQPYEVWPVGVIVKTRPVLEKAKKP